MGKTLVRLAFIFIASACAGTFSSAGNIITTSTSTSVLREAADTAEPMSVSIPTTTPDSVDPSYDSSMRVDCGINPALQTCPKLIVDWITQQLTWGTKEDIRRISNLVGDWGASLGYFQSEGYLPYYNNAQDFGVFLADAIVIQDLACMGYTSWSSGPPNKMFVFYSGVKIQTDFREFDSDVDSIGFIFQFDNGKYYLFSVIHESKLYLDEVFLDYPLLPCPQ